MLVAPPAGPLASAAESISAGPPAGVLIGFGALYLMMLGLFGWQLARTFSPRRRADDLARMAQQFNLLIDDEVVDALERYLASRVRGRLVGGAAGFTALAVAYLTGALWAPGGFTGVLGFASYAAVATFGLFGSLIGGTIGRRSAAGHTSAARLQPLHVNELLLPIERRIARWTALVGVPLTIVIASLTAAPWVDPQRSAIVDPRGPLALSVVGAAIFALLPALARTVQRLRAIGGGENALAWSDALAARTVRDAHLIGLVLTGGSAIVAAMSIGFAFPADWRDASLVVLNVTAPIGVLVVVGTLAIIQAKSPDRFVQRTLWPQFALNPNLDRPSRYGEESAEADAERRSDAQ